MGDVVVIADDDEDIVCFVALNLRLEGFDVVAAHDGQEALTKALDMQPSLILLDTTMPRMDGYEVCAKLRGDECGRTIPVIMLTANSLKTDRALALTVGADDWVTKPFDPAELMSQSKNTDRARPSGTVARDRQCSLANAVLLALPLGKRLIEPAEELSQRIRHSVLTGQNRPTQHDDGSASPATCNITSVAVGMAAGASLACIPSICFRPTGTASA